MNPNHDVSVRENGRVRVRTVNTEPSLTVQTQVQEAEIRHILAKYEQTGVLLNMRNVDLEYRDVSEFTDFVDLMRQATNAKQAFMRLPAEVRKAFDHDHFAWLDAAHDGLTEEQHARLVKAGVLEAVEKEPGRAPDPPTPPPASE